MPAHAARAAHEYVDLAKTGDRVPDERFRRTRHGHVGAGAGCRSALRDDFRHGRIDGLPAARGDDHRRAFARQFQRDGPPDALAPARHDGGLARQPQFHRFPLLRPDRP